MKDVVSFKGVSELKLVEMEDTGKYRVVVTQRSDSKSFSSSFGVDVVTAEDIKDIAEMRSSSVERHLPKQKTGGEV